MSAPSNNKNATKTLQPSAKGIGAPPSYFTDELKQIWDEVVTNATPHTLGSPDRLALEQYCHLILEYRKDPLDMSGDRMRMLYSLTNSFGGTPASRAKLNVKSESEKTKSKFDNL